MSRRDHYHDPAAPIASRLVPAVTAVVIEHGKVLLQHRIDNDLWALPGGLIEVGETPSQAAIRETLEETGIDIEVLGVVGVYSDPGHVISYDDGEVRQQFSVCLAARSVGGELAAQEFEVRRVAWVSVDDLDQLDIHPAQRIRVKHGLAWHPGGSAYVD